MKRLAPAALCALLASGVLFCGRPAAALTIYRIGGENHPLPEIEAPFEFVQLSWAEVDPGRHGAAEFVAIAPDSIAPAYFDPERNLAPVLSEFGGRVSVKTWAGWSSPTPEDAMAFDGDPSTAFIGDAGIKRTRNDPDQKHFLFSFGTPLFLQRIRFFSRERFRDDRFLERFVVAARDEDPLKAGTRELVVGDCQVACEELDFTVVHDVAENTSADVELGLPPEPVSQLLFQGYRNRRGIWELAELEIFGGGYVPFSSYVSNVIALGEPASLGDLAWSGRIGPGSRVDLSARFGVDDDPAIYWRFTFDGDEASRFDRDGNELTLSTWSSLPSLERARVSHDSRHWEFWSAPYRFGDGAAILGAPGARGFVQFRAEMHSTPAGAGRVDYLQFSATRPPVVSDAVAEIAPAVAPAGRATSFTFRLRPFLAGGDRGFDAVEIFTPVRPASVDAVRVSGLDVGVDTLRVAESGFSVRIPRFDLQRTGELIEVDFSAEVFKYSTRFAARVFDSTTPHEVHQSVREGEADAFSDGDGLEVQLEEFIEETILSMGLSSPVLTPNRDGVNDVVTVEFDLVNLVAAVPVALELFDLSGRRLGTVYEGAAANGRFGAAWNGEIEGRMPAPGLYVLRLEVRADNRRETARRALAVAY